MDKVNSSYMKDHLRDMIGEQSPKHWADLELLRYLNMAQRRVWNRTVAAVNDFMVEAASVTPSGGTISLPSNCGKVVCLELASNGQKISLSGSIREYSQTYPRDLYPSSILRGYIQGDSILLSDLSFSETLTLRYQRRIPDLHFGTADAGGSLSLTLEAANKPSSRDDYYNDSWIEVFAGSGAGSLAQVEDYDGGSAIATMSEGSFGASSEYGTISLLPEEGHDLVVLEAVGLALTKPSSAIDPKYYDFILNQIEREASQFTDWASSRLSGDLHIRYTREG